MRRRVATGKVDSMAAPPSSRRLDTKTAKALAHPLRQRILLELERGVASPNEISQALEEPLNLVAYHVRILREAKCIELVSRRQVRGAIEHFYRPTSRTLLDDVAFAKLPLALRRRLVGQTLEQIWDDARAAAKVDGFDDREVHVSRTLLDLDDEGYADMVALLAGTLERALEIHAASAGRQTGDEETRTHLTELGLVHFHRAPDPKTRPRRPR
jgi:DNA-binding transcriptional ArsR family regulator